MNDIALQLQSMVLTARQQKQQIQIKGGGSKSFYGNTVNADISLSTTAHCGIIEYEKSELMLKARAGTSLLELKKTLAKNNQYLPFDPPLYHSGSTLGGCIASALSGPRRMYSGSVRDYVIGLTLLNGQGEILTFGGNVLKNVAGFDVSRLMVGALGTLGVILDVTLKVMPRPQNEQTVCLAQDKLTALRTLQSLSNTRLAITSSAINDDGLILRIDERNPKIGFDYREYDAQYWADLRDHRLDFFNPKEDLWKIVCLPSTPYAPQFQPQIIEWGGALRWIYAASPETIKQYKNAVLFKTLKGDQIRFPALSERLLKIHQGIKKQFDPQNLFNPGKLDKLL